MPAAAGILVLVERSSVEAGKSVGVRGEVGRNPVDDYADAVLVELINEVLEIINLAEP